MTLCGAPCVLTIRLGTGKVHCSNYTVHRDKWDRDVVDSSVLSDSRCLSSRRFAVFIRFVRFIGFIFVFRTEKLAADLFSSYPPGEPILLICVLKSALGFFNALLASLQNLNQCASTSISPARRHDIDRIKNSQFGQENADRTPEKNSEMASSHPLLLEFIRVRSYENDHSTGQVEIDGISDMKASVAGMVSHAETFSDFCP
jgi:hypothetical protein